MSSAKPIFSLSSTQIKEAQIQEQIKRLDGPIRHTARDEFCSGQILESVSGSLPGHHRRVQAREFVQSHNAAFDALSAAEQRRFHMLAQQTKARKQRDRYAALGRLELELRTLQREAAVEAQAHDGCPHLVSSFRLSDEELLSVCQLYDSYLRSGTCNVSLLSPPGVPDIDMQTMVEETGNSLRGPWQPLSSGGDLLQRIICRERRHFIDMCFGVGSNESEPTSRIFVFLFAMQQPLATVFLKCTLTEEPWPAALPVYSGMALEFVVGTETFEHEENLFVQSVAFSGLLATPFGAREDAHMFCSRFPEPSPSSGSGSSSARAKAPDAVIDQIRCKLPWLCEAEIRAYLKESSTPAARATGESGHGGDAAAPLVPLPPMAEDAAQALLDARARIEVDGDEPDYADFYPKVLGGKWTAAHMHIPYDRVAALARNHTLAFRMAFGLPQMHSLKIDTYGGEANCHQLVRGWCAKQTYYYRLWLDKPAGVDFTSDEHHGYFESEDWLEWAIALPMDSPVWAKVMELRNWRPKL